MYSTMVILDTTPESFRLWLKDATYPDTWLFSDDSLMLQNPAVGSFYDRDWYWEVPGICFHEPTVDFRNDSLVSFEVFPIAPTRIKVRADTDEFGRSALDALIVRMQEELSGTQLTTITSTKEAKGESSDASWAKPGRWSPEPQEKLEIWLGWRTAQRKGTRQSVYCDSLVPQIDTSTLRRYKRELVELGLLDKEGNAVRPHPNSP